MKTAKIIIALFLLLSINTHAQNIYNVTRVNGNVTILGSGKDVVAGDVLSPDEFLLFESLESYLIVIGDELNRFQIKIQESQLWPTHKC